MHGMLPSRLPGGDLLLLAGDLCPYGSNEFQAQWLDVLFRWWLDRQPYTHIVGVAGNHDFVFEAGAQPADLPWTYLQDSGCIIDGLAVWGTPWQPVMGDWAFNATRGDLDRRFALVPDSTDILV